MLREKQKRERQREGRGKGRRIETFVRSFLECEVWVSDERN